jgi:hypothetical protein
VGKKTLGDADAGVRRGPFGSRDVRPAFEQFGRQVRRDYRRISEAFAPEYERWKVLAHEHSDCDVRTVSLGATAMGLGGLEQRLGSATSRSETIADAPIAR